MRPSREQMYMAMARAAASRATCYRLNVGAVVVHEGNVVGIGYNGAPAGKPHCTGNGCRYFSPGGCQVVHAERNAIERARSFDPRVCDLYVTHSPCNACAGLIIEVNDDARAGDGNLPDWYPCIQAVYFETAYRDPSPIQVLLAAEVKVYQVLPSGLVVDHATGGLCEPS